MTEDETGAELEEPVEAPAEIGPEDFTMLLRSVPERVSDLLLGLTPAQLAYRHGPAFPTVEEIARHLAATGAELDAEATALALGTEPAAPPAGGEAGLADLLQDWQRRRRRAADLLRGLPPERWDDGAAELCRRALQHELGHLSQLRNLTALVPVT